MATYNPPSFPRKPNPKQSNIFSELRYQAQLAYYRYEVDTALYVMSPGEKFAYNIIFLSFLILFFSAIVYVLPTAVYVSTHRLAYYFTGTGKLHVTGLSALVGERARSSASEAVRSLTDAGRAINATVLAP